MTTYGPQGATDGEKCSNMTETYTCPGCYTDYDKRVSRCDRCNAPLRCYKEEVPHYVCEVDERDERVDEE